MTTTTPFTPSTPWPDLPFEDWSDTRETLHLWTQIVGKIRMVQSPWINHSWSVPLYISANGLRTSLVPYGGEGFELAFDLVRHRLELTTTRGDHRTIGLVDQSVAEFYAGVIDAMNEVKMGVSINTTPNEVPEAIPFEQDTIHHTYKPEHAHALWTALVRASHAMTRFRAGFLGKASPVHFFWGSFDLAATRFSGRSAPPHPGGLPNFPHDVAQEAYSHEVTSVGFWPGNRESPTPLFYAYAYPSPEDFSHAQISPDAAVWLDELGEFILPYPSLLQQDEPDSALQQFFQSTHAAAADLAGWDRSATECDDPHGPDWWANRNREVADHGSCPDV